VHLAYAHLHQGLASEALAVVERAPLTVADRPSVIKAKVRCLDELGRSDEVESVLREAIAVYPDKPDFYLALAEHLKERGDNEGARWALDDGVQALPRNEAILARLARLLSEHFDKTLALHLYEQLCWLKPDSPEYPTLLANILLELELNDSAMHKYRRANELAEGKQAWILANIGNLYKNRGFFREGIDFLQRALQLEPEDQYAHERLAAAIKLRDEEEKRLEDILQNARKELARQRDTKKQPKQ
jgi:tetratricopeptide (TPR) repeat protein